MPLSNDQIQRAESLCSLLESIQRVFACAAGGSQQLNLKAAGDAVALEIKTELTSAGGEA